MDNSNFNLNFKILLFISYSLTNISLSDGTVISLVAQQNPAVIKTNTKLRLKLNLRSKIYEVRFSKRIYTGQNKIK